MTKRKRQMKEREGEKKSAGNKNLFLSPSFSLSLTLSLSFHPLLTHRTVLSSINFVPHRTSILYVPSFLSWSLAPFSPIFPSFSTSDSLSLPPSSLVLSFSRSLCVYVCPVERKSCCRRFDSPLFFLIWLQLLSQLLMLLRLIPESGSNIDSNTMCPYVRYCDSFPFLVLVVLSFTQRVTHTCVHTVSTHSITHLLLETRWIFFAPKSVLSLSLSFCPGLFFLFALFFVLLPPSFLQSVSSFGEAVAVNHRNRQTQREKKRFSYTHTVIKGLGFSPPSLLLLLLVLQLLWPSVSLFLCVSLSLSLSIFFFFFSFFFFLFLLSKSQVILRIKTSREKELREKIPPATRLFGFFSHLLLLLLLLLHFFFFFSFSLSSFSEKIFLSTEFIFSPSSPSPSSSLFLPKKLSSWKWPVLLSDPKWQKQMTKGCNSFTQQSSLLCVCVCCVCVCVCVNVCCLFSSCFLFSLPVVCHSFASLLLLLPSSVFRLVQSCLLLLSSLPCLSDYVWDSPLVRLQLTAVSQLFLLEMESSTEKRVRVRAATVVGRKEGMKEKEGERERGVTLTVHEPRAVRVRVMDTEGENVGKRTEQLQSSSSRTKRVRE